MDNRLNGAYTWFVKYYDVDKVIERPRYTDSTKRQPELYK